MRRRKGFTLIEVMVAVTILGLGLTMILSSQVGLFASVQRVQNETVATNLLRCKMSEIEIELLIDRKSTRLNSSHIQKSRMPSSA